MSTHLDGHEFHLPPPVDANPRLEIFDDGDGRLRLVRGTREVGWLAHRTIGFRGFPDADTARAAASVAYSALSRWIARQSRTAPVPSRRRPLSRRRDGVTEWLTLGGLPVGRLVHLTASETDADDATPISDVSFELFLPARVTEGLRLRAACVVERTLAAPPVSRSPDRPVDREPTTAA